MNKISKSKKLSNLLYDMRGLVMGAAAEMESAGQRVLKLNIGNLSDFGFDAPEHVRKTMSARMRASAGYSDSKGILPAREAVVREALAEGILGVTVEDVYIGNGASELISMALGTLLDDGDEILLPSPGFPLWSGAATLAGGVAVHYLCDENAGWMPVIEDIRSKVSVRAKAIVIVNPNNPTGALYDKELLLKIIEVARIHGLVIFADEVCSKLLYEGHCHTAIGSLCDDVIVLTFNSISKNYLASGYRGGWMIVSGPKKYAQDFIGGLNLLSYMKLCSNVPGQWAVEAALSGGQSIAPYIEHGGRLRRQRDIAWEMMLNIEGVSCVKPRAGLYMFPRLDPAIYPIVDDEQFCADLLRRTGVMLVQGSAFNWQAPNHFRMVFLPHEAELRDALNKIADHLESLRIEFGTR